MQEAFEALGLDQLVQDGQLAFLREGVLLELVGAFEARLQPGLLLRLGDVHELDADIAAVGTAQDGQHLADAAGLQAQHPVQIDGAVQVGLGEAVELGGQFGVVGRLLDAQRVERRLQVTADAVAADQHQGADRIVGGGADRLGRDGRGGCGGGCGGRSGAGFLRIGLGGGPATVEDGGGLGGLGVDRTAPRAGGARGADAVGVVPQLVEEGAPLGRNGRRIGGPLLVQVLDERGVGAIQEAGLCKDLVQPTGVVSHRIVTSLAAVRARLRATGAADIGAVSLSVMTEWGRKGRKSPIWGEIRTFLVPLSGQEISP
ncbi:hypothetical protein ASD25_08060 [Brevundimonas sp. Root1423]|nr:hypothetical protein ASD25_08060 [Brevundimonas sp. Root1423]